MISFFKKIYSILLRQNHWWLEQFEAAPSLPLLIGFFLATCYIIVVVLFKLNTTTKVSGIVIGISSILIALSGILWIREGRFPFYITGMFQGSSLYQKIQAMFWVVFWGGMGVLLIISSVFEW